jgi:hypothetical protein
LFQNPLLTVVDVRGGELSLKQVSEDGEILNQVQVTKMTSKAKPVAFEEHKSRLGCNASQLWRWDGE